MSTKRTWPPQDWDQIFVLRHQCTSINALMTRVTSRRWYDRLDDTVILGALPVKSVTRELIEQENVKAMVSVNEDFELRCLTYSSEVLKSMGVERLQLRTTDYTGTPAQEHIAQAMQFILEHQKLGDSVYVHCKAGRTRSATIAACYLLQNNKWKPEEAIEFIKAKRPQIWLRQKQLDSIVSFYENHLKT